MHATLVLTGLSLTSLVPRLFKPGGRLIRHARYFVLQLAESYLTGGLFRPILHCIERRAWQHKREEKMGHLGNRG